MVKKKRPSIEEEVEVVVIEDSDDTKEPEVEKTEKIEEVEKVEEEEKEDKPEKSSAGHEEEASEPFSKKELEEENNNRPSFLKTVFWMIFPVILLILAAGAGIFIYNLGVEKGKQEAQAVITPTPEPTSAPTHAIQLKRQDLKIQVLNGAGVAQTASKAKTFLEELGYEDIDTGNAGSFDFEQTVIAIKEEREDIGELLKDDLSSDYNVSEDFETLDEDSDYDAVVTIGSSD